MLYGIQGQIPSQLPGWLELQLVMWPGICVQELGADAVIDYTKDRFEQVCRRRPFDAILDLVGGKLVGPGMCEVMPGADERLACGGIPAW